MELPKVLQARSGKEHLHRLGLSAFARAVVHDRHTRFDGMNEDLRIRRRLPMMGDDGQIDGANRIVRAHELVLGVRSQIAQVDDAEVTELCDDAHRLGVFTVVFALCYEIGAVAVAYASAPQRPAQDLLRGRNDRDVDAGQGNAIPGCYNRVASASVQRSVRRVEKLGHPGIRFDAGTVVDEVAHRNPSGEFLHRSPVVAVPVRRDQVVDLGD